MSRVYIQPSWVDACSDHTEWSGQSPDNRKCASVELFLPNGKANISAFSEQPTKKPEKRKQDKPIANKIVPQFSTLDKLDTQELSLHKAYKNEEVSLEEYEELLYALDQKRERAFRSVNKALGRPLDDGVVGYDGGEDKTLNWYDKALTKGGFEGNLGYIGGSVRKSLKKDMIFFLLCSILGCILIMYLAN